ncbi:MAG: type II CAAX endopeptidase family protein [Candidatus Neomarinimicrobiota bacterium]|nr:type II CAAX endopeptidase family protein [Candidatus Neomarinimicrobiota bacterium]|tara:strand:+ start:246 stop:1043 length:798 start_codon:yes stop_codon:yes gene_type:complete
MSRVLTVRLAFGIVILSFLCSLFIAAIFSALDPSILSGSNLGILSYIALFLAQIFLVAPSALFLVKNGFNLSDNFRLNKISKQMVLLSLILSFGAVLLSSEMNILIDIVFPIPQSFLNLDALLAPGNPISFILVILTVVIIAPIGEEMVFRGFLQRYLEDAWQDVTRAILISSLFFAAIHFNPYWAIQIYFMGLLLGYLSWLTKSIFPSIIMHMAINGTSMLFIFLGDNAESALLWKGHVNPLLLMIGAYAFWFSLKHMPYESRT